MREIQAIIFDMDGVLIDSERIVTDCWRAVSEEMKIPNIDEAIYGCIGLNRNDTQAFFYNIYGKQFSYDTFAVRVSDMFKDQIQREGLPLKEGVREILSFLKQNNYKIGLASSSRYQSVCGHMERLGLMDYFEIIIGGDMVEHSKPLPDIYLKACEAIGVKPENSMAIEDSPNGIRAAVAANMKAVMVPDMIASTPEIQAMLFREFRNLLEVQDYLMKENQEIL